VSTEVILHNAKIATNGVPSFVEAIAISDGNVIAIGGNEEILRLRGPATSVIDGRGAHRHSWTHDSHMHPIRGGLNYNLELRWDGCTFARGRSAHAERAGGADACSAVGPSYRRMDRVSVCRAPDANAR